LDRGSHSATFLKTENPLRHLFKHAVRLGMRRDNPVAETERLKTTAGGVHTWTDSEIEQYRNHWPLGTQQRLCMELALETTSRRTDVTLIGPQHRRGNVLDLRHTKNDAEAFIPLSDELRAAIEACPTKHLILMTAGPCYAEPLRSTSIPSNLANDEKRLMPKVMSEFYGPFEKETGYWG
jgi:hypothetical protein